LASPQGPRIRLQRTLLPAQLVDRLALRLAPLTAYRVLALGTGLGVAAYLHGLERLAVGSPLRPATGWEWAAGLGLFLLTAIWHELGHAAALRREGLPAGRVGAGVLLVVPVLFCDVTLVGLLPRRGRLRVDAAGVAFQLASGGMLFASGVLGGWAPGRLAGLSALAAVSWSLLPFIRADGYWVLCDLLDRRDLETPLVVREGRAGTAEAAGRNQVFWPVLLLIAYRLTYVLFLLLVAVGMPWRLVQRLHLATWWGGGWPLRLLAAACGLMLLVGTVFLWSVVARRVRACVVSCARDVALLRSVDRHGWILRIKRALPSVGRQQGRGGKEA
jgi:hypothetical protein